MVATSSLRGESHREAPFAGLEAIHPIRGVAIGVTAGRSPTHPWPSSIRQTAVGFPRFQKIVSVLKHEPDGYKLQPVAGEKEPLRAEPFTEVEFRLSTRLGPAPG